VEIGKTVVQGLPEQKVRETQISTNKWGKPVAPVMQETRDECILVQGWHLGKNKRPHPKITKSKKKKKELGVWLKWYSTCLASRRS
jgi:hypothetical protein